MCVRVCVTCTRTESMRAYCVSKCYSVLFIQLFESYCWETAFCGALWDEMDAEELAGNTEHRYPWRHDTSTYYCKLYSREQKSSTMEKVRSNWLVLEIGQTFRRRPFGVRVFPLTLNVASRNPPLWIWVSLYLGRPPYTHRRKADLANSKALESY